MRVFNSAYKLNACLASGTVFKHISSMRISSKIHTDHFKASLFKYVQISCCFQCLFFAR